MKIPKGLTEDKLVSIANKVISRLVHKFTFGYHSVNDIRQQAWIYIIDALERYDDKKPLENFLWTHVRNRLCNFKRDSYERLDKPCLNCPFNEYDTETDMCLAHIDCMDCSIYNKWFVRNSCKKNIMEPIGLDVLDDTDEKNAKEESDPLNNLYNKEIIAKIEKNLSGQERIYWIHLKNGIKITKTNKQKLLNAITIILNGEI